MTVLIITCSIYAQLIATNLQWMIRISRDEKISYLMAHYFRVKSKTVKSKFIWEFFELIWRKEHFCVWWELDILLISTFLFFSFFAYHSLDTSPNPLVSRLVSKNCTWNQIRINTTTNLTFFYELVFFSLFLNHQFIIFYIFLFFRP